MATTKNTIEIEISPKSIFLLLGITAGIWLLFKIKYVLFIFFLGFILASALLIPVQELQKRKLSKPLSILVVYLFVGILFIGVLSLITVPLAQETGRFFSHLPELIVDMITSANSFFMQIGLDQASIDPNIISNSITEWTNSITENLGNIVSVGAQGASGIYSFLSNVFGGFFTLILIITVSIYMVYDHENWMETLLGQFADSSFRDRVEKLVKDIEVNLGRWLVAQLSASAFVGALCWALLSILNVQYALPLSLFTAIMNPIPIIGAIVSAVPGILVALAGGDMVQIIFVPLAYLFIQQVESNVVTPRIISNAVGLPPLIVILALLVGAQISGFAGMILAVPTAGILHLGMKFWSESSRK